MYIHVMPSDFDFIFASNSPLFYLAMYTIGDIPPLPHFCPFPPSLQKSPRAAKICNIRIPTPRYPFPSPFMHSPLSPTLRR